MMSGDENSKDAWDGILEPMSDLTVNSNTSVCLVHHLGKQSAENPRNAVNRLRGSSNLASWFTCGIFLSGKISDGKVDCELVQRRSGKVPSEFRIDVIEDAWDEDDETEEKGLFKLKVAFPDKKENKKLRKAAKAEAALQDAEQTVLETMGEQPGVWMSIREIRRKAGVERDLLKDVLLRLKREERILFDKEDGENLYSVQSKPPVPGNGIDAKPRQVTKKEAQTELSDIPF
jgi:hypothetical protein